MGNAFWILVFVAGLGVTMCWSSPPYSELFTARASDDDEIVFINIDDDMTLTMPECPEGWGRVEVEIAPGHSDYETVFVDCGRVVDDAASEAPPHDDVVREPRDG